MAIPLSRAALSRRARERGLPGGTSRMRRGCLRAKPEGGRGCASDALTRLRAAPATTLSRMRERVRSARIVFDDEIGLHRHRIGDVGQFWRADEPPAHPVMVDLDILGYVALARSRRLEDQHHLLCPLPQFNRVAVTQLVGRDVDPLAVD